MKKRKRHGNTPRRKRMNREGRLRIAREWINTYRGKNIIKAYARWFAVDWLCALQELKLAGVPISKDQEEKTVLNYNDRVRQKRREKELRKAKAKAPFINTEEGHDYGLAVVIGYTDGGFPYGITFEEAERLKEGPVVTVFEESSYDEQFEVDDPGIKEETSEKQDPDNEDIDLPF